MTIEKSKAVGTHLTEGPILLPLIQFAIPLVLANLVQQVYSMVDLVVIKNYVGSVGTVGVTVGGEIADLASPIAIGLASAGQIYISQLFGAKEENKLGTAVGTLLSFMLLCSCALSIIAIIFSRPILEALNCPREAFSQAQSYLIFTAVGIPFVFGYNAVCGILRGMGESKRPLIFIIIAAVLNIFLDLLLVAVFRLEAFGTAVATSFSQAASFTAAFIFLLRKKDKLPFNLRSVFPMLNKEVVIIILKLGIPQIIRTLLVRFSLLYLNSNLNAYGMVVSETNNVGNKLQKFLELFTQGVDTASSAMIGQNLGAKKPDRASKITLYTLATTMTCAVPVSLLCWFFPRQIFSIFSSNSEVLELSVVFLHIMIIQFFVASFVGAFQAMVTGSGFVSLGFFIGILDGVVCKVGLGLLFTRVFHMDFTGFWWGITLSRVLPGILCAAYFFSGKWRTRKLLTES